ncbi:MAG: hypothetical protein M0P71_07320 [Melioribacteraceae bacterium]|jgi:hypothetical protein|nr:hypothetical protein [Melioribacteraceae bacterium]
MYKNVIDKQLTAGQTLAIPHTMTKKLFTDMSYPWLIIVEPFPHDSTKGAHIELVSWDMDYITLKNCEAVTVPMMIYMDQMHSVSTAHKDSDQYTPQIPPIVAPNFGTLPSSETLNSVGTRVRSPMYICLKDTVQPAFNPNSLVTKYVNPGLAHTDIDGSGVWAAGDDANSGDDKLHPWQSLQTAINRWQDGSETYLIKVDETVDHCARSYAIQSSVAAPNGQIVLAGDQSAYLAAGQHVRITGSPTPANNNTYTILSIVVAGDTTITFNEPIAVGEVAPNAGTFWGVGAIEEQVSICNIKRDGYLMISGTTKKVQENLIHKYPIIAAANDGGNTMVTIADTGSIAPLSIGQPIEIIGSTPGVNSIDGYWTIINLVAVPGVSIAITISQAWSGLAPAAFGDFYDGQYRTYDPTYPEGWSSLICKLDRPILSYPDIKTDWLECRTFWFGYQNTDLKIKILEYETIDPVNFIYKLKLGGYSNYMLNNSINSLSEYCSRIRMATVQRGNLLSTDYRNMLISNNSEMGFTNFQIGDETVVKKYYSSEFYGHINFINVNLYDFYGGFHNIDSKNHFTQQLFRRSYVTQVCNIIDDFTNNYLCFFNFQAIACLYHLPVMGFDLTDVFCLWDTTTPDYTLFFRTIQVDSSDLTSINDLYVRDKLIRFGTGTWFINGRATLGKGLDIKNTCGKQDSIKFILNCAYALNSGYGLTNPNYKTSFNGDPVNCSDGYNGRIYMDYAQLYSVAPILFPDNNIQLKYFMHLNHNSKFYSESYVEASKTDGTLGDMFWIENNSEFICLGDPVLSRDCADYNVAIHNYVFNVNNSYLRCGDVEIDIVAALQTQGMQGLFKLTNSDAVFNTFYCDYERDVNVSNFGGADINGANNGMMVMDEKSSLVFESVIDGRDNASLLIDRINVGGNPLIADQFYMFKAMDSYTITSIGNFIFNGVDIGGAAVGHYFYFDGNGSFDIRGLKIEEAPEINGLQGFLATKVPIFMLNQAEGFCLEAIYCLVYGAAAGSLPTRFLRMWLDTELLCNAIGFYAGDPTHTFGESYILDDITVAYDSKLTTISGGDVKNYIDCRYFNGTWSPYGDRYASLYVLNSEFINLGRVEFVLEKGGRVLNFINSRIKTAGLRFLGDSTGAVVIPPYPTEVFISSCSDVCMFMNSIDFRSGDYGDYVGIYGNDYVHTWIIIDDSSRIIVECEPTEAALPGYNVFDATAYQTNNCAIALRNASVILCKEVHDPDTARGTYYWACLRDDDPINVYQDFHLGAVGAVATVDTWPTSVTGKWNDVNADNLGAAGNPGLAELVLVSLPAPPVG